jgi:hypothetical protein
MGKETDLRRRTMTFAVAVSDLCELLPRTFKGNHVAGQLFRASSAVAANYRAACRARSRPDFIAKLGIVIEESDESDFAERPIRIEANELIAIFTQSQKTARNNQGR